MENELAKAYIAGSLEQASRSRRRLKSGLAHLNRFPLWKRVVFYWRFKNVRNRLSDHSAAIAGHMWIVTRLNKKLRRSSCSSS